MAFATRPPLPGESVKVMSNQSHIADTSSPHDPYNSDPPTSGQHVSYTAPWGVHKEPLDKEVLVHNLEDPLTAWGRIDRLDSFEQERIVDFISAYKGKDHH